MLRSLDDLKQYAIHATDGDLGKVIDFYFDDERWTIRYLVVDAGSWLTSRKVLITPIAIGKPNWVNKTLPVGITQEQVKNSPNIDTDKPVSRQHEDEYLNYYGYPSYWGGSGLWGADMYPDMMIPGSFGFDGSVVNTQEQERGEKGLSRTNDQHNQYQKDDIHLRSCKEVIGYHIHATDGDIGHVSGMLVDELTWAIRYLIVDTSNWWLGHQVLIAPLWIDQIQWPQRHITVNLNRQETQHSINYNPADKLD